MRSNGALLSPHKNPQYGKLGKVKGGQEITKVDHQLNCDVQGSDPITIAVLLANIAAGSKSHMEHLLAVIEGRLFDNRIISARGGQISSGISEWGYFVSKRPVKA